MTSREALTFFKDIPAIKEKLASLCEVGLDYVKIGQQATTLSGGEAQRIKLASCIDESQTEHILYVFDEPTTGLHIDDIETLLKCFNRLIDKGHTVLIIEHNLHIIAAADFIVDLGPEAGEKGGYVIAQGTPEHIASLEHSYTGKALKQHFITYS